MKEVIGAVECADESAGTVEHGIAASNANEQAPPTLASAVPPDAAPASPIERLVLQVLSTLGC